MALELATTGRPDRDIAIDLRERVRSRLADILPLMDEANRAGMRIEFMLAVDNFGRNIVQRIVVLKELG